MAASDSKAPQAHAKANLVPTKPKRSAGRAFNELHDFDSLPDSALVRQRTVEALFSICDVSVWRWVKSGRLPAPVKLSCRVNGYNVGEVRTALAKLQKGRPEMPPTRRSVVSGSAS